VPAAPAAPGPALDLRATWRRAARTGLVLLVGGSVAVTLLSQVGRASHVRVRFEPLWLALAVAGFVAFLVIQLEAFRFMLRAMGTPLPARRARSVWCASLLARYVPTGMLAFVVRVAYGDREGVPKRVSLVVFVYEITLSTAAALVIGAYSIISLPTLSGVPARWLVVALPILAIVALHPRVFGPVTTAVLRRLGREPLPRLLGVRTALAFLAVYGLSLLAAGAGVYGLLEAIHPVAAGHVTVAVTAYALAFVAGMVGFAIPGGIGAREAGLVAGLSPVAPAAIALGVAVAARLLQTAVELASASIVSVHGRLGAR
jgi:uncharacterized membrane protein YbhN (UPF0104 family)